jgi:hypothetical protein
MLVTLFAIEPIAICKKVVICSETAAVTEKHWGAAPSLSFFSRSIS